MKSFIAEKPYLHKDMCQCCGNVIPREERQIEARQNFLKKILISSRKNAHIEQQDTNSIRRIERVTLYERLRHGFLPDLGNICIKKTLSTGIKNALYKDYKIRGALYDQRRVKIIRERYEQNNIMRAWHLIMYNSQKAALGGPVYKYDKVLGEEIIHKKGTAMLKSYSANSNSTRLALKEIGQDTFTRAKDRFARALNTIPEEDTKKNASDDEDI